MQSIRLSAFEVDVLAALNRTHRLWADEHAQLLRRGPENTTIAIGTMIVRWAVDADAVAREAQLLLGLAQETRSVAVPEPLIIDPHHRIIVYRRIEGRLLIERRHLITDALESGVIELLAALRTVAPGLDLAVDGYSNANWHQDALEDYHAVRRQLDEEQRTVIATALAESPPSDSETVVAQHNDFGIEHFLVDRHGTLCGVIDWSDAALSAPWRDLGMIYRDLGPAAAGRIAAALDERVTDEAVAQMRFHARCKWLEDARFALADPTARAVYLANVHATFVHTFAQAE